MKRKLTDYGVLQGYKEINRRLAEIPCAMAGREKKFKNAAIRLGEVVLVSLIRSEGDVIGGLGGSLIRWTLLLGSEIWNICAQVRSSVLLRCDIWH
jgi:hypothetical protein